MTPVTMLFIIFYHALNFELLNNKSFKLCHQKIEGQRIWHSKYYKNRKILENR